MKDAVSEELNCQTARVCSEFEFLSQAWVSVLLLEFKVCVFVGFPFSVSALVPVCSLV